MALRTPKVGEKVAVVTEGFSEHSHYFEAGMVVEVKGEPMKLSADIEVFEAYHAETGGTQWLQATDVVPYCEA